MIVILAPRQSVFKVKEGLAPASRLPAGGVTQAAADNLSNPTIL